MDSVNFLASPLSKVTSYLKELKIGHEILSKDEFTEAQILLLLKKGVFPYKFVNSLDSLNITYLPTKKDFFNELTHQHFSDEEFHHAQQVGTDFSCKTIGEYSDMYLNTDILLLAEVFECFRSLCLNSYQLDAANYITAPSLGWDALLKISGVNLELLTDINMLLFVERGFRSELSNCVHLHAKANNKFMENFVPEDENVFLFYFDIINLYGFAMEQYLPVGHFS